MYTLYIGNKNYSSWSLRPWLLLTELGIPFNEQLVPFDDGGSWTKFRAFSPTGLVPCLHVDNLPGIGSVVWESLGITEFPAEDHPQVWPADRSARAWARSATAEMHAGFSALRNECPMSVGLRVQLHDQSAALRQNLTRLAELWQQGLDTFGGPFLAGAEFCAVDSFFAPVAFRIQTYDLQLPKPALEYAQRLLGLEGMQAWTDAALKETYREESHEAEFFELGRITADLRAK